ncbi:MAG: hypothetical protein EXR65_04040 [Dehalococcoidia bacterium]|nr:hypothetical protein [Dehalococcoidia bacterium]
MAAVARPASAVWRFLAIWLLVRVVGRLPVCTLYAGADVAAALAWAASPRLRAVTRGHMRHALTRGDVAPSTQAVDRAARGCARSAARYYADFARSPHQAPERAFAEVECWDGIDHFFSAYDRGCGVIMISAHLGGPEFLVRAASFLGMEMLALTEPLSPPRLHALVHEVRNAPGARFVPTGRGGVRETIEQLRGGRVVALLADRELQGAGRSVPFFGERTRLPSGPVELALRTGAAVVPTFTYRTGTARYRVVFKPALALPRGGGREAEVEAGMLALACVLEDGIRAAPEQWFALQPVWRGLPR